jgi:hypothetical protein
MRHITSDRPSPAWLVTPPVEHRSTSMKRKLALSLALGALLALGMAGSALATHQVPASATPVNVALVPVFKQCGTPGNPANGQHAPPLGPSCNPPQSNSPNVRMDGFGAGSATLSVVSGDVNIIVDEKGLSVVSTGADYNPSGTSDLALVWKMRTSDHNNCTPAACSGPYTQPATTIDSDFGPIPFNCLPVGDPTMPPGSDCSLSTTMNTFMPGVVVAGKVASLQVFRMRVNDAGANGVSGDGDDKLFQQQGIFIP